MSEIMGKDRAAIRDNPTVTPSGDNLLERVRTQWQFGDWQNLAQLEQDILQHHPDRAYLALLAAAGRLQTGQDAEARQYIRLAQNWGASKKLISQILIACVHNSIGRTAAIGNQQQRAMQHFANAITIGTPASETKLLTLSRSRHQLDLLGIEILENGQLCFTRLNNPGNFAKQKRQTTPAGRARYLNQNGEELYKEGKYKFALEYFERALRLDPENAWYCQNLAEAAARLNFKKGDQWECEKLGETIDETGKWDVAVRHYRRALKLDPKQVEANRAEQTFKIEPAQAGQIENPIFIIGCGHSGTSLMLAILGNHPRINPIPKESALFLRTDASIQKALREWDAECITQGKARWAEKTPPHIFQIHRFLAFRPKAQFIIMLRDGRDVVCSLKPRVGYATFEDRLDRWIYDNIAGLPWWQHQQVKVIKYEELVTATEATLRGLCQFLGEDYSPQLLEYHKTEHRWYSDTIERPDAIRTNDDHNTNRNWQINQPIFDGRGRWRSEMTDVEKELFKNSRAQPLMEQFGYVDDPSWNPTAGMTFQAERFPNNPLITRTSSPTLGVNINGPSVIRVPDWLPNPLGHYYLYFAHHAGTYIRMAYADKLQGPWKIHEPGTLQLSDAETFQDHIASPDVHVDHTTKQIRMYFHGPAKYRPGQWTGVAYSKDGINFTAKPDLLAKFYFRAWKWKDHWYAVAKNNNEGWGELYRAQHPDGPFEIRGSILKDMRHAAILVEENMLRIFYSRVGDAPERILMVSVDMNENWLTWQSTDPVEVHRPSKEYEGVFYPIVPSEQGAATKVHQLRDPFVLTKDDDWVMFYTGAGEECICGAIVTKKPINHFQPRN